jgi:hypothetical protein
VKLEAEYLSSGQAAGGTRRGVGGSFVKQNQGYGMGTRMSY